MSKSNRFSWYSVESLSWWESLYHFILLRVLRERAGLVYFKFLAFSPLQFYNKCELISSQVIFFFFPFSLNEHTVTEAQVTACTPLLDLCNYTFPFEKLHAESTMQIYFRSGTWLRGLNFCAWELQIAAGLRLCALCVFVIIFFLMYFKVKLHLYVGLSSK